ncbi:FAD dependent oxidoreductase [Irpex rosettiformis]|uniref:FAD dependent oxidoreductase n=1 Tax=Irpex rosettiformis TaxID=378272 RepID=A0ACB8UAV3_9APHY|nr:FAD dependent oxidoreductase [Irpex rosettiformis]
MTEKPTLPVPLNAHKTQHAVLTDPNRIGTAGTSLPVPNPTTSFWQTEPLNESSVSIGVNEEWTDDVDICIIGSGITGVSAAYHLSKIFAQDGSLSPDEPVKTVILDAREFCNGATGRNGGHLTATGYDGFVSRSAKHGLPNALREAYLQEHTVNSLVQLIKDEHLSDAVDLVSGGFVYVFFIDEEEHNAKEDVAAALNAGFAVRRVEWLTKEQMEQEYGTPYPGIRLPGNNLWPRKLIQALHALTLRRSPPTRFTLSIHTFTPVTSITPISDEESTKIRKRRWNVNTPRGTITSSYILHATNAYVSHLLPHLHGPEGVIPGRGQIMATRASVGRLPLTAFGANEGFEYWFPRPLKSQADVDNERPLVILGGGREAAERYELYETDDSKVDEELSRTMKRFLPAVFPGKFEEGKEPEMEWSGIMGFTKTGDPLVGPVVDPNDTSDVDQYEGQYICAGFSGHGMPRAFACAEAVAGMIANDIMIAGGSKEKWTPPSWIPLHYLTRNE